MNDNVIEFKKEKTYRYSEIFYSFQGEAELAGKPTVWLRFFGCNLECNGFGQKDPANPDTYILPYKDFDVSTVEKLEDLPVWNYGCDSSYSWSAKYKKLVHDDTVKGICDKLTDQMKSPSNPDGQFLHPVTYQDTQLAFTGGEPMLYQNAMIEIVREFIRRGNPPHTVTVETNATQPITEELNEFLFQEFYDGGGNRWHWAMSPKLYFTSGEKMAVKPEIMYDYLDCCSGIVKFVCDGTDDSWFELEQSRYRIQKYFQEQNVAAPEFWVMPVGATKDAQETDQTSKIAMEAMRMGYNVATRNHCYVFGNVIGK